MSINRLLRDNIRSLVPYTSARDEFSDADGVFLDANESPFSNGYNRYPDPLQNDLKQAIAKQKGLNANQVFIGNGSDETLDLLIRAFCEPKKDNILIMPPTYGMYKVLANINAVECLEAPLNRDFSLGADSVLSVVNENTKMIFVCSPNNPTGNNLNQEEIIKILNAFKGVVVLDEAYADFSREPSFIKELDRFPYLFVNQTLSKSFSGAGLRLGMGFSSPELNQVLNRIKPPYNINTLTQNKGLDLINDTTTYQYNLNTILSEKEAMYRQLLTLGLVLEIFPSDANFWLVKVTDAATIYMQLREQGIVVRNRSMELYCDQSLRITVGSKSENKKLIEALIKIDENLNQKKS